MIKPAKIAANGVERLLGWQVWGDAARVLPAQRRGPNVVQKAFMKKR